MLMSRQVLEELVPASMAATPMPDYGRLGKHFKNALAYTLLPSRIPTL
jgi:hypothetical protein